MQKAKSKQEFFGGIPTAPDVRNLCEAWPPTHLEDGDRMEYEEVERIIRAARKSERFGTVTTAWRRQVERETGKIIGAVKGEAFVVLNNSEKLDLSGAKIKTAVRHVRRGYQVAGLTDRKQLSVEEAARLDHITNISVRLQETARLACRAQLPEI
jgi:hypothetical protein